MLLFGVWVLGGKLLLNNRLEVLGIADIHPGLPRMMSKQQRDRTAIAIRLVDRRQRLFAVACSAFITSRYLQSDKHVQESNTQSTRRYKSRNFFAS